MVYRFVSSFLSCNVLRINPSLADPPVTFFIREGYLMNA